MAATEVDRFMEKVMAEPMSGCWLWTGSSFGRYGMWHIHNRPSEAAHRASYRYFKGPIPDGLVIDHLCRTELCVNPTHLEAVTHRENNRRRRNAQAMQTVCVNGHPFDAANTRTVRTTKGVKRACKACDNRRHREMRDRQKNELMTPTSHGLEVQPQAVTGGR